MNLRPLMGFNYNMTADQKTRLASFLDLAADTLRDGYSRERAPYTFSDGPERSPSEPGRPLVLLIGEGLEDGGPAPLSRGAAELLDRMLASIGLYRGRNCLSAEKENQAVELSDLKPRVILCLGGEPSGQLLSLGIPLLSTYHPDELLQKGDLKRPAWEDLKSLRTKLTELDQDYARSLADRP